MSALESYEQFSPSPKEQMQHFLPPTHAVPKKAPPPIYWAAPSGKPLTLQLRTQPHPRQLLSACAVAAHAADSGCSAHTVHRFTDQPRPGSAIGWRHPDLRGARGIPGHGTARINQRTNTSLSSSCLRGQSIKKLLFTSHDGGSESGDPGRRERSVGPNKYPMASPSRSIPSRMASACAASALNLA